MTKRQFQWLAGDQRTREFELWSGWLKRVPKARNDFGLSNHGDDPLLYNETASVGILASAASRSGLLALSEYVATKRGAGRGRAHRNGRCDLWVQHPASRTAWSFEFKQCFCAAGIRLPSIRSRLWQACKDADDVTPFEADRHFGVLLISSYAYGEVSEKSIENIEALARQQTFACRLGGGVKDVWMIARDIRLGNWKKDLA